MNVWKYGDNINTDMLFPGRYTYTCSTAEEIKPHLLEDMDKEFAGKIKSGDVILAGKNFGCGSSREQPALGLKAVGVLAIVAESFARIFYRASLNQGLLLIECPEAVQAYQPGDVITIDQENGRIHVGDKAFSYPPLPRAIMDIWQAGGLLPYARQKLASAKKGDTHV
ncbi:3-isopropylmalate dehydratase [candidate division KSB1 bacterium]|nr:3-isopropylmalate dehydratase [candidate division KSB1 bacterium]